MRTAFLFFLLCFTGFYLGAQQLPANIAAAVNSKPPKETARLLDSVAGSLRKSNMYLSIQVAKYNFHFCIQNKLMKAATKCYLNISRTYRNKGLFDSSFIYIDSARKFAFDNKVHEQYWNVYDHEGLTWMRKSDYPRATASMFRAVGYAEAEKDSFALHTVFDHMGTVEFYRLDYAKAAEYYKKSLTYHTEDPGMSVGTLDNLALCYSNRNMMDSALLYQKQVVETAEQMNDSSFLAEAYINIASTYLLKNRYDEAEHYLQKAVAIDEAQRYDYGLINCYINLGRLYLSTHREKRSVELLEKAYTIAKRLKLPSQVKEVCSSLSEAYSATGDYKSAYAAQRELVEVMKTIYTEENAKAVNELSARYETRQKQQQIQLLTKDGELQKQTIKNEHYKNIIYGVAAFIFLLLSALFIVRFRRKKRDNHILQEKNDAIAAQKNQIEEQKEELQHKNTEITDSINYAQRIQSSVIPSQSLINAVFPDSFIYFQPKDIVSGDFYWMAEKNDCIYFAVADCTGHGVPGAMMSMLGTSLLNQIIAGEQLKMPAQVLKELHYQVVKSLNENIERRDSKDGMDIALILIDRAKQIIMYSGAGRPLYSIQNNELQIIKADKYSIGGILGAHNARFESHEISIRQGTQLYLFSDGVPDQFGGPKGKKFMTRQLQDIIVGMHSLPMKEQGLHFKTIFEEWKKNTEQTDDVTLTGIRFN